MRAAILIALLPTLALAQSPVPRPEDLGTVTGRVVCSDTQSPARFAQVHLVPVTPDSTHLGFIDTRGFQFLPEAFTDMSGGYTISHVVPGQYYLRVDLRGYITPMASFTPEQLSKPTPEDQQRIERELQVVTVALHSTLRVDATLQRSASISGTVLYDDGAPAIGIRMHLLLRTAKGEFRDNNSTGAFTDPRGTYHIEPVTPGEYAVQANFYFNEQVHSTSPDGLATITSLNLPIYSGDPVSVVRVKDAAVVKADAGRIITGVDITLPISQLHEISGTLFAKDGHTINTGNVTLLFADDRSYFATVSVGADAMINYPYVPERSYILTVQGACDVTYVQVFNGTPQPTRSRPQITRNYGTLEQPLTVQTDIQSLNLVVPDRTTSTADKSTGNN